MRRSEITLQHRSQWRRPLGCAVLLGLCAIRCEVPLAPEPLQRFTDCNALQDYLEDQIVNPAPLPARVEVGLLTGCSDAGLQPEEELTFNSTPAAVDGVEEPDFVKTDGTRLFVVRRRTLSIVDIEDADALQTRAQVELAGLPFGLVLDGAEGGAPATRAVVLAHVFGRGAQPDVEAQVLDVSVTPPQLLRVVRVAGRFVAARRVDDLLLLVTAAELGDVPLSAEPFSADENRKRLRAAGLERLLPVVSDQQMGVDPAPREDVAAACTNTYAPSRSDGKSLLLVQGVPLRDPAAPLQNAAFVGAVSHVLATPEQLVLAATAVEDGGYFTDAYAVTRLWTLALGDAAGDPTRAAAPVATGVLPGALLDDLALAALPPDANGATPLAAVLTGPAREPGAPQLATLHVLAPDGAQLEEVARMDDVGAGGTVDAVRFVGARAVLALHTAERPRVEQDALSPLGFPPDPPLSTLRTVDLSDPNAPTLAGDVLVDGFIGALHPLDDTHLLALASTQGTGALATGLSLSRVELQEGVATITHSTRFTGDTTATEALLERHALSILPTGPGAALVALPVVAVNATGVVVSSALFAFAVDGATGFSPLGHLEQLPLLGQATPIARAVAPCALVRRSVIVRRGVGDSAQSTLFAVSSLGISAAHVNADSLAPAGTLRLLQPTDALCDAEGGAL